MSRSYGAYTDVAGCTLWVDCLSGVTLVGSNATVLADKSGAGLFAGVSVANSVAAGLATAVGPVYSASDSNFSGTPSLTWTSGATHTAMETGVVAAQGGSWTFLACIRATGSQDSVNSRFFIDGPGGAALANTFRISAPVAANSANSTTDGFASVGPFLAKVSTIPSLGSSAHVVAVVVSQGNGSFGPLTLYKDGVVVAHGSFAVTTSRTLTGLRLGHSAANSATVNFEGQMNAMVAWSGTLSEGKVIAMSRLMALRHGVSLNGRNAATGRASISGRVPVSGRTAP